MYAISWIKSRILVRESMEYHDVETLSDSWHVYLHFGRFRSYIIEKGVHNTHATSLQWLDKYGL